MKNFLLLILVFACSINLFAQGSETFENPSPALPGSYNTGSFVGDNGVTWDYVESRNDAGYEITGEGIMLRRSSDNSALSTTAVPNGIGDFSCDLLKAFTGSGNRQVELFVNGVSQGTSIAWDNTMVQTFTVSGINILGAVTIEIRNITSKQVIVDNISWTAAPSSGNPIVGFDATTDNDSEGSAAGGNSTISIPLTMDVAPTADVTVDVASTDGTATTADNDYLAVSTSFTFTTGETYPSTKNVMLTIVGDDTIESDEDLTLNLSISSGTADLSTSTHTFTILNDDVLPPSDVVINEIMYDADVNETTGEWIELFNTGAADSDLSCFVITDGDWDISLPSGTTILAGDYLTIGRPTAEDGIGGTFTPDIDLTTCNCASSLSTSSGAVSFTNSGEFVALFDSGGGFVDGFQFESPSSGNLPSAAGTESVSAQGGCPAITVDIAGNASFSGGGFASRANNFEDAGGAAGSPGGGITVGRFPDGSGTFRYFETTDISPGAANVLPVELLNFDAKIQNEQVEIFWATSMELHNSHFEIQHSIDNRTYTTIDKQEGAGNSDTRVDYNFIHDYPTNGVNYYRLQQFDFDGQSEYSPVVSVQFGKDAGISLAPNPVQNEIIVALGEEFTTNATAEIISQNGSSVFTQTFTEKSFSQTIKVNNLPAGVYVLRIVNGNEVYTERFVKK